MIKVHGWQVAPAELEAVLLTHPQVINAAVIGIPLKDGTGEVPQAFVVLKPKPLDGTYASHDELEVSKTTEIELKTYMASRLAKYKALHRIIFVDDIPRTASGKLQKVKLRELYASLSKTTKRKHSAIKTAEGPKDINGTQEVVSDGAMEVIHIGSSHSKRDGTGGNEYTSRSKRVKKMPRLGVNGRPIGKEEMKRSSSKAILHSDSVA